jgi:hypothetical protein
MQIDHPHQWELAIASGVDEPGRCVFVDREFRRLDVRWKPVQHVPNLDLLLDKHRRQQHGAATLSQLADPPPPWQGVVRRAEEAQVVHAGRFFKETRWLVEASLVWPRRRDTELERAILASIVPQSPGDAERLWQAMGISLTIGREFQLVRSRAQVGRVRWDFQTPKKGPTVHVERIALPEHWLKSSLDDWLLHELPPNSQVLRRTKVPCRGHEAEMLLSRTKAGIVATLRGLRRVRLDLAWQCPVDGRLYHVTQGQCTRQPEIALTESLTVRCCRPPPRIDADA